MEIAFVTPGVLTDAGGYIIYVGSDGKLHVKKIPPWDPETRFELQAAFAILDQAARVKNERYAKQMVALSEQLIQQHVGQLEKAVGAGQLVG